MIESKKMKLLTAYTLVCEVERLTNEICLGTYCGSCPIRDCLIIGNDSNLDHLDSLKRFYEDAVLQALI